MLAVENTWCPRGLFSAKIPGGNKRLVRFMFTEKKKEGEKKREKEQLDWNKFGAAASRWVGGERKNKRKSKLSLEWDEMKRCGSEGRHRVERQKVQKCFCCIRCIKVTHFSLCVQSTAPPLFMQRLY